MVTSLVFATLGVGAGYMTSSSPGTVDSYARRIMGGAAVSVSISALQKRISSPQAMELIRRNGKRIPGMDKLVVPTHTWKILKQDFKAAVFSLG